jgi:hypothetical protein
MSMDLPFLTADLDFRTEFADTLSDPLLVVQHIEAVLNIAVGEWLVDARQGMPWLQMAVQSKRVTPATFRRAIEGVLADIPEIRVISVTATVASATRRLEAVIVAQIQEQRLTGTVFASLDAPAPGDNSVFAAFAPILRVG